MSKESKPKLFHHYFNIEIAAKNMAFKKDGSTRNYDGRAFVWDYPSGRDVSFRMNIIHGGFGDGPDQRINYAPCGSSEYDVVQGDRFNYQDTIGYYKRNNAVVIRNGDATCHNLGSGYFPPFVCDIVNVPLNNDAYRSDTCAFIAAASKGGNWDRYYAGKFQTGYQGIPNWFETAMAPEASRCIDTGKELVWIYEGTPTYHGAIGIRVEAEDTNQLVTEKDGRQYCTAFPPDKDPIGRICAKSYYGEQRGFLEKFKISQGMNGKNDWDPSLSKGSKFLYVMVVPHIGGFDSAWDADFETSSDCVLPYGLLFDGRKLIVSHHSELDVNGLETAKYYRLVLDLDSRTFSKEYFTNKDDLSPFAWERQTMRTAGGRYACFSNAYRITSNDIDHIGIGIVNRSNGTITHRAYSNGIMTVPRDPLVMDHIPLNVRSKPILTIGSDAQARGRFDSYVTWGLTLPNGDQEFTIGAFPPALFNVRAVGISDPYPQIPRTLATANYTYDNTTGILSIPMDLVAGTDVIVDGVVVSASGPKTWSIPALGEPVWTNPPQDGSLVSLGNRKYRLEFGPNALPESSNRYLVHGDFDCSMREFAQLRFWPYSTEFKIGRSNGTDELRYWMCDTTKRDFSKNIHSHRASALVLDISNVDRHAEGKRALIRPDRVTWFIPCTVTPTPNDVDLGAPVLVDLEVPEDGMVTFHSFGTCMFEVFTKDGLDPVSPIRAEYHNTLSLRLVRGTYTLRVGIHPKWHSSVSTLYEGWYWKYADNSFLIDCGYWVP